MHNTQMAHMQLSIDTYLRRDRHYDVLDFGSQAAGNGHTHRELLEGYDVTYTGVDVTAGENVDVVMRKPYRLPMKTNSFDLVITGSAFEHIPFMWASFLEISRVVRPGGLIFLTAPSRGHIHFEMDCWRFYPDSMRALAAFARMELVEAHTDMPPKGEGGRVDYTEVSFPRNYWGDTVGVFRKPLRYSYLVRGIREVVVWWANRIGGIEKTPRKYGSKARYDLVPQRGPRPQAAPAPVAPTPVAAAPADTRPETG
ncbi:class I SAM-dependent methyltransferase [Jatrophihabitans sp.]|uniref:class I SAM-dependent methyltransferase n=1 Tax=Jatrophihabitans sp. TaxID=1932789 RepID=UPI0030C6DF27|nr:Methyltransferase protein [Jatrophihabitans sp.]